MRLSCRLLEDDISEGHVAWFSIQPGDAVTADVEVSVLSDGKAYYAMHCFFRVRGDFDGFHGEVSYVQYSDEC